MNFKQERKILFSFVTVFFILYFLPSSTTKFQTAIIEAFELTKWYVREHIIFCLVPALFIAGGISVFVSQASVMRYFGAGAKKILSYGVASVSGTILAVCSCTVLPLFAGIYKRGAGLGPAIAFLYSGPGINILALILTARILGFEMGVARAIGAVLFSLVIGLLMHLIFIKEEKQKAGNQSNIIVPHIKRPLWQTTFYFASMVFILVFANWGKENDTSGFFYSIYKLKWILTSISAAFMGFILVFWFGANKKKILISSGVVFMLAILFSDMPVIAFSAGFIGLSWIIAGEDGELGEWFFASWEIAKQIFPLLIVGVFVSGFLLGRPGNEGIIPSRWVAWAVGGNSFFANLFSSIVGAFMYFATLTEVPIIQGLIGSGMGKGPALALLLAGPALSLPGMLVLKVVMGTRKTAIYITLVVVMATISGLIYGVFF